MKYWRRKQFLAVLMVFSLIGTAGCGRVSGTGPNGRGVEEKESVVPEENGGKATPENSSESEGGTDTRVNDEDEITESDFKNPTVKLGRESRTGNRIVLSGKSLYGIGNAVGDGRWRDETTVTGRLKRPG